MNTYITLLVYPILIILLLVNSKFAGKNEFNNEWSSIGQSKAILGFISICIVCHHTAQQTSVVWLESGNIVNGLNFFNDIGFVLVSLFFFWSGYGLFKSTIKKQRYLSGFIKKRLVPVWIPYFVVCLLFTFLRLFILDEKMSTTYKVTNFTGITTGYSYGWYIQAIIIFYLLYYIAFKYGAYEFDKISFVWAGTFLWIATGICIDHNAWFMRGEWWYNSVILFPIGVTFAKFDSEIIDFLKKKYMLYTVCSLILTVIFMGFYKIMEGEYGYYGEVMGVKTGIKILWRIMTLAPQILCAISFVLFTIMLSLKLCIGNRALKFLGEHTLEVYLTHGFFLDPLAAKYNYAKESMFFGRPWLLLLVTIIFTIPSAYLLKKLTGVVLKVIDRNRK
ncbi:MAG: acyltransferase [Lachnospiraceae bacterium]|nr:acyltransferase [Lachnospiraceae bacterium]